MAGPARSAGAGAAPVLRRYCAGVSTTLRLNRRPKKLLSWSPTSVAAASTGSSLDSSICLAPSRRSMCTHSSGLMPVACVKRRLKVRSGTPDSDAICVTGDSLR